MTELRVLCPRCGEDIGLSDDEYVGPVSAEVASLHFASFVCHVCHSGWRVYPRFEAFKTDDDEEKGG